MWDCPVFGRKEQDATFCQQCGFDSSTNYEAYPTLAPIPEGLPSVAARRAALLGEPISVERKVVPAEERVSAPEQKKVVRQEVTAVLQREAPQPQANAQKPCSKNKPANKRLMLCLSLAVVIMAAVFIAKATIPSASHSEETIIAEDTADTFVLSAPGELSSVGEEGELVLTLTTKGETAVLTPVFSPEGTTAQLAWSCTDWSVAEVDPYGVVTAKAPGTATISATMANGEFATCEVTCMPENRVLSLNTNRIELEIGETFTLEATLTPPDDSIEKSYTSNNPNIASVTQDGTVIAHSRGMTTITVNCSGEIAYCVVSCGNLIQEFKPSP